MPGVLLVLALLVAACVGSDASTVGGEAGAGAEGEQEAVVRTTIIPGMRPTSAVDLGIALDQTGRPYDNYVGPQEITTRTRLLAGLTIDRGRFYLLPGEALISGDPIASAEKVTVNFRDATDLDLRVIWQRAADPPDADSDSGSDSDEEESESQPADTILGMQVFVRGTTVARWGRLEPAYDTRRGLGGIMSRTAFEAARDTLEQDQPVIAEDLEGSRQFLLADLAGEVGRDVVLFAHGGGPGSYLYTEGFDEDDRLVAITIWDPSYPWRSAVPVGEPPPDITEREQELTDCIEGRRAIDRWGRCT